MQILDALQWPAMAATLLAAWLVASQSQHRRSLAFGVFILSNALWIVWGWHDGAYALIALQIGLLFLNWRGARKNEPVARQRHAPAAKPAFRVRRRTERESAPTVH